MRTHAALALAAGLFFTFGATSVLADTMSTPSSNSMSSPMSSPMSSTQGMSSANAMSSDHMAAPGNHKHKNKKHAAGAMQSGGMAPGGDAMTPANAQTH
jgi:hypothetical protein